MIGLVARVAAAVSHSRTGEDSNVDPDADGVFWITRHSCRTCQQPIADPESKPTAPDNSDPLANAMNGARSTFCSMECKREFQEVFGE